MENINAVMINDNIPQNERLLRLNKIAIQQMTILVEVQDKETLKMTKAEIFYKDIGDYLSREEKLKIVREEKSILNPDLKMSRLNPNEHGDWLNKFI